MNLQLKGKSALVAGSSRGIGRAIAESLLLEGCRVCLTGREPNSLQETHELFINKFGENAVIAANGDLSSSQDTKRILNYATNTFSGLDFLVANLGTGRGQAGFQVEEQEWDRLFQANFFTAVYLAQATIPIFERQGGGVIIFVASITGIESTAAPLPYSAAKAALINYSKNLSVLLAEKNIRVNCVAPGNVLFPGGRWDIRSQENPDAVHQMLMSTVPMKRFGTPQEIADLVVFLCSERAAFITGACFVADGGQTKRV